MLYQVQITWDDISSSSALTSLTPVSVIRPINLYDGLYKGKVIGFSYLDNLPNGVAASNQTLVNINSSRFSFPAQGGQGLWFTDRMDHVDPHIKGDHCFMVNNIGGNLDFQITIQQFNDNRTKNNNGTWNTSGFLALILTLDLEKVEQ